jgi:cyanophycinase-like exopeptidase
MTRLLTVMGSGETTPTMVTTHRRIVDRIGPDPVAVLLDTPYGFQQNADEITDKTLRYFADSVGLDVGVVSLRRADAVSDVRREALLAEVREADWVFAGPGSPTYLARQWAASRVPEALLSRLRGEGATVLASAAAATLGSHALPVYEIYKAGADPHWVDGLDLLSAIGLDAVCIPHFDNHDGGTHDTRFCYLGDERLRAMEAQLPETTWVLGVDEHTAVTVDLDAGRVAVEGRGCLSVRARDVTVTFEAGRALALEELTAAARGTATAAGPPGAGRPPSEAEGPAASGSSQRTPLQELVAMRAGEFDAALGAGRALDAAEQAVALEDEVRKWSTDVAELDHLDRARAEVHRQVTALARAAQAGMHEHRDLVAPHVELLLALRDRARQDGRYTDADAIRHALVAGGVEVRDTPTGAEWAFEEPR